ncbi:DUF1573 domain-containing protein [Pedobacter sp. L105]|uniref:Ig-like domain-containing protein n=1 Tax=Pedobacter sp. L105 TaxID=1641871 RepID=UPI00352AC621
MYKLYLYFSLFSIILFFSCKEEKPIFKSNPIDVGIVQPSETKNSNLTIYNVGNSKLNIINYIVSCECISIKLRKNVIILPGDSLKVPFKILASGSHSNLDKLVLFTFKDNTENIFERVYIKYHTM